MSRYLQDLIKHPSWLHAQPEVIKVAFQIEEGVLPCEEMLYDAIMAWAKYTPNMQSALEHKADGPFEGVDDSTASVQPIKQTTSLYDPEQEAAKVASLSATPPEDEEETPTVICFAEDRKEGLAEILQYIRFPLMEPAYLVNNVEKDHHVMELPGVRDLVSHTIHVK